jgi:Na+/melibiose symporter-like transporter
MIGSMLFFAMPALAKALGLTANADLGFPALELTAIICAVVVPGIAILVVWRIPEGEAAQPSPREQRHYGLAETLRSLASNRPMLHMLIALAPFSILGGMAAGVSFLYMDIYLGLSEAFPTIMLITMPMGLIGIPLWSWLCMKFERHRVMAASALLTGIAYAGMSLVSPGPASAPIVMVFYPMTMLAFSGLVGLYPMIGDVSDYGRLTTGKDLTGLYTAVINFVQVSLRTVTTAAGMAFVGWLGFDAAVSTQTEAGSFGIRLVAVILPAVGAGISAILFWTFPLTRARLAEIQHELAEREAAQAADVAPA